jgi:hypothetical protein
MLAAVGTLTEVTLRVFTFQIQPYSQIETTGGAMQTASKVCANSAPK